jgi:4-amino-4-deoxy-L-arabinose transferase-like glycosyltransferase
VKLEGPAAPSKTAHAIFVGLWLLGMAASLCVGPRLGEHEVIVAQSARQMLSSGDWLIPHYLDTPFLVKPPLAAWLVATVSRVLPKDHALAMPVTDFSARLPSVVAVIITVLIIRRLARSLFDERVAAISAMVCASSLGMLLFAQNATSEALLTLFCTWAFAEFWWAQTKPDQRTMHLARFYAALGLGMLAKGPMPMIVVVIPLAVWWFGHRGLRRLGSMKLGEFGRIARTTIFESGPRFRQALTTNGLWWGIPVFLAMFLPWMVRVSRQEPYAWALWNHEFLDRARGDYPGCHWGDFFYYVPILFGLVLPWCLSLPEALASPFLKSYRRYARPLNYVWCWVVVAFVILSVMSFKKPYYTLPIVPGCALLLGPVLDQLFFRSVVPIRRAVLAIGAILSILSTICVVGWFVGRRMYPEEWHGRVAWATPIFAVLILVGMAGAGVMFVRSQRWPSISMVAATGIASFVGVWCFVGPAAGNVDATDQLVESLRKENVPDNANLYWAGNRPDGRLTFYWNRPIRQVVDPYKLMAEQATNRAAWIYECRSRIGFVHFSTKTRTFTWCFNAKISIR